MVVDQGGIGGRTAMRYVAGEVNRADRKQKINKNITVIVEKCIETIYNYQPVNHGCTAVLLLPYFTEYGYSTGNT